MIKRALLMTLTKLSLKHFLIAIILLPTLASSTEANNNYVISYVEHESIIKYYVPLLKKAYRSIGIVPEFVLINDKRALKLLNNGHIDADTAKTTEILGDYPNIIKVPTPISKIRVVLVCQENLTCDLSALANSRKILGVIGAKEFYSNLLKDSKIKVVELNSFNVILKMFQQNKVDYIFMVFDDYSKPTEVNFTNRFLIEEKIGYHLLHKKHQALIPELDKAIQATVAKGGFIKW